MDSTLLLARKRHSLIVICIWASLLPLVWTFSSSQQILKDTQNPQTTHDKLGAVASENKICSQIGIDLLNSGGNAADAVRSPALSLTPQLISF